MAERASIRAYGTAMALVAASLASLDDYHDERERLLELVERCVAEQRRQLLRDVLDALVVVTRSSTLALTEQTGERPLTWLLERVELMERAL